MKKALLFVTIAAFTLVGCGGGDSAPIVKTIDPSKKMGSILKRSVDGTGIGEKVPFTGFCTSKITKEMEDEIGKTGVEVAKVVDNYFVARGSKEEVYKIASLTFVERLEGTKFDSFKK